MPTLRLRFRPGPATTKPPPPSNQTPSDETPEDTQTQKPKTTLASLPPELHILISRHLIYPDALSLKHTNRYFFALVDTGVRLKVSWLLSRRRLHLECPTSSLRGGACDLGSDVRFCRGSVALLMRRRREHGECESRPGLGCLIYGTERCAVARQLRVRARRWLRTRVVAVEVWGVLLLVGVVGAVVVGVVVYWVMRV
ncbi:hypothetical protein QBC39DRAFT_247094 [Podospora conica]|nr:hypothetical protein QBC39DRAFT_247094 [Schizothecium conicum]